MDKITEEHLRNRWFLTGKILRNETTKHNTIIDIYYVLLQPMTYFPALENVVSDILEIYNKCNFNTMSFTR